MCTAGALFLGCGDTVKVPPPPGPQETAGETVTASDGGDGTGTGGSDAGEESGTGTGGGEPYDGPLFVDVTEAAGVLYEQHAVATDEADCLLAHLDKGDRCEPERMTGGAAAGDYDADGWIDLFVTRLDAPDILFRNAGDGTFADVTAGSGLDADLQTNGAGWADIDNDGDLDLYVTTVGERRNYLYINDGSGGFAEEGLDRGASVDNDTLHVGQSVAFGDYDLDGFLDLHVTEWRSNLLAGGDDVLSNSRLLHNLGSMQPGHFEDRTMAAGVELDGIADDGRWGFASTFVDLDDDGLPDLAVASDWGTSRLFWNDGDGTFTDGTVAAGVGLDETGMGSTFGDLDGDGRFDWFVSAIHPPGCFEPCGNKLYMSAGGRTFTEAANDRGVNDGMWGWGTALWDMDNDMDLDIVLTNGMDHPDPAYNVPQFKTDPMRMWVNEGGMVLREVAEAAGLKDRRAGKGLLTFDYDADGDLDLFIVNNGDRPTLYRNDGGNDNDWLRVDVLHASGRHALGARITVTTSPGGTPALREVGVGAHFLSQGENTGHFGLGPNGDPVAEVTVQWPDGAQETLTDVARNQTLVVTPP